MEAMNLDFHLSKEGCFVIFFKLLDFKCKVVFRLSQSSRFNLHSFSATYGLCFYLWAPEVSPAHYTAPLCAAAVVNPHTWTHTATHTHTRGHTPYGYTLMHSRFINLAECQLLVSNLFAGIIE